MNFIIDSALYSTALLAAAWLICLLLGRASADLRHRVWLTAILAAGMLPALLWLAPEKLPQAIRIWAPPSIANPAAISHAASFLDFRRDIWLTGLAICLIRLAIGCLSILRVTGTASITRDPGVWMSERVVAPLTWGVFRPVILLPAYAESWTEEQRLLALSHERAHIERHDWLWQTLARIAAAIFWFQPLMWLALAGMRREAERAADDRVLADGACAPGYAAQLVEVARRMNGAAPAFAMAMVRNGKLEDRISAILDGSQNRSRTSRVARAGIAVGAAALLFPMIAIHAQVYKIGGDVKSPSIVSKVDPAYTQEARDAKIQGAVVLQVEIDENGVPQNIEVVQSLDPGLDSNAVSAVYQWQFAPGTKDGEPVRTKARIQIDFKLK